jgi:hypothetical protein
MANNRIPLPKLINELQQLCQQKRTGRLIVTTENNRFVSFGLKSGRIILVNYADKTGEEALTMIAELSSVTAFSFMEIANDTGTSESLPQNEKIFQRLGQPIPVSVEKPTVNGMSPDIKVILEESLATHIGPMAKIVCERIFRFENNVNSAIDKLADTIPDAEHARAFRDEIRNRLQ